MNFSQTRSRVIRGHLKEKVLFLKPPNLGKTAVLQGLHIALAEIFCQKTGILYENLKIVTMGK